MRRWNATAGPIVSLVLIALNAVVFLLTSTNGRVEFELVLFGPAVEAGEYYRLVTSGFVHFGLLHVGFNMALLYRLGSELEALLGRTLFVLLYFASLLGGSLGALLLSPDAFTGGASGAVFGIMAAAVVANRVSRHPVVDPSVGMLLVVNLLLTFGIPGISIGGHLGGAVTGALVGGVIFAVKNGR